VASAGCVSRSFPRVRTGLSRNDRCYPTMVGIILAPFLALFGIVSGYALIRAWTRIGLWSKATTASLTLAAVASANSMLFTSSSILQLGGTAEFGKIEGNHYFVGDHGRYRAVSETVYRRNLSYGHASNIFVGTSWILFSLPLLWGRFVGKKLRSLDHLSLASIAGLTDVKPPAQK